MKISSVKIISLLFFVLSAFYLYTANQIQVFAFDVNSPFNAKTFPIYLGYAGMFFAGLQILLPEKSVEKVNHNVLDYKKVIYLVLFIYINFFVTILLLFRGAKMETNDYFFFPICSCIYVFTSWSLKHLS